MNLIGYDGPVNMTITNIADLNISAYCIFLLRLWYRMWIRGQTSRKEHRKFTLYSLFLFHIRYKFRCKLQLELNLFNPIAINLLQLLQVLGEHHQKLLNLMQLEYHRENCFPQRSKWICTRLNTAIPMQIGIQFL